jgi:DNA-binding transcriptional MerR regulator
MKIGLKIGDVSKGSGLSPDTIRYYEGFGLLKPRGRSQSGYRYYDNDALPKLVFIKNTQKLGFSLKEVKSLLSLRSDKTAKAGQVKNETRKKLEQIRQKQKNLNAIMKVLKHMIDSCDRENVPVEQCPILKSLQDFELNHLERKTLKEGGHL